MEITLDTYILIRGQNALPYDDALFKSEEDAKLYAFNLGEGFKVKLLSEHLADLDNLIRSLHSQLR